jgi:SRSO17 transposase
MAAAFASRVGCFVVEDVAFPKQGRHSVGVQRQSYGCGTRKTNCQVAVALHYVSPLGHYPLGLRLYLPGPWLGDSGRLDQAGVPAAERRPLTKGDIAVELLDRVRGEGQPGWLVVAGPGYGTSASFRAGLAARGLRYIADVTDDFEVFPEIPVEVRTGTADPGPPLAHQRPVPVRELIGPAQLLPRSYNECSRKRPPAHVLWRRVWPGQNPATEAGADVEPLWLLAEEREDGRVRYALSNLAADTSQKMALRLWKSRWLMELDYRMMNERLGLNHFEGRSWRGFHHHACMILLAFGFLALQAKQSPQGNPIPEMQEQAPQ